jgi:putative Mg2+ transporter-C (MgtC) family protein
MRQVVIALEQAPIAEQLDMAVLVMIAIILGSLTGMERRKADKPAGTRTHALVAGAAALITAISIAAVESFGSGDPTRGLHAVITGIGFLGAGAILHPRSGTQGPTGLTTAASIFYTACVGVAVAAGYVVVACIATFLEFALLRLVGMWRYRHEKSPNVSPTEADLTD